VTSVAATVSLALLSHTNAGKTTLARTLLRQDIGAVLDRAHVTEVAESHVLLQTGAGDRLVLWDTPGFGDSVRLLRRLEQSGNPLGWFLTQVWDRFADRPFWCSQQALRAARDSADVVLYVVNATEDPQSAGYVAPELRIMEWLAKPALLLLNQLGTVATPEATTAEVSRWQEALRTSVTAANWEVLPFDAFARCWLQEHTLLAAIRSVLPEPQHGVFDRLSAEWRDRDRSVLTQSAQIIATQIAALVNDTEQVPEARFVDKARRWAGEVSGRDAASPEEARAQAAMLQRLDLRVRESTAALVHLHGLTGDAGETILAMLGGEFSVERAPDADKAGVLGGLVSGALGGIAADLAAGGLTFGAGALLGGVAGALGARTLAQRYNAQRGTSGSEIKWSDAFVGQRLAAAVLRYLAVAHFGRGRGEFVAGAIPAHWDETIAAVLTQHETALAAAIRDARAAPEAIGSLSALVRSLLWQALVILYPEPARTFEDAAV
jgi:GTPase Era involved in 16S rRNA processing